MVYFIVAPRGFERTQTRSLVSVHHSASFRVFSCRFVSFRVFCVARRLASAIGAATSHGRKNAKQRLFSSRRRSAVAAAASALVLTVVRSTSTCGRRNHRPRRELIPPPSPPPPLRALFRGPRNPPPPPPPPPPPLASLLPGPSSLFRLRTTTTRRTARLGISASSGSRGGASPFRPRGCFCRRRRWRLRRRRPSRETWEGSCNPWRGAQPRRIGGTWPPGGWGNCGRSDRCRRT